MFPTRWWWGLLAGSLSVSPWLASAAHAAEPIEPLSLRVARERAHAAHPSVAAARHEHAAARALEREAGRRPAPSLAAAYENFGGGLHGLAETTLSLEQPFELGGESAARRAVSAAQSSIAEADLARHRAALDGDVVAAFTEAWEAQERAAQLLEAVRGSEVAATAAAERFKSGAAPAHEEARARSNLALRRIELEREARRLDAARARLAAYWRGEPDSVGSLVLPSAASLTPPSWDSLASALVRQPELRRADAERRRELERQRLLRAQRFPDLVLSAGARHLADVPGTGFVASVSVPFPGPGTGPAALEAARSSSDAADSRVQAERSRLLSDLRAVHDRLRGALASLRELEQGVLPAAEEAMRGLAAGFRAGRFTYVEVLEGQRGLLEARFLGLELTREAWNAQLELERWGAAQATEVRP